MTIAWIILVAVIVALNLFIGVVLLGSVFGASFGAPFVPSDRQTIQKMLNLAQIKKAEKVYDLGCGDGRLVFAAEQAGAKCTGIEISHPIYVLAFLRKVLTKKKTRLIRANIFKTSIKDADVIFLFLLPKLMERFYQEIYPTLKPNTRIISNAFQIKSLKPVQKINKKQNGQSSIYLFVKE